MQLDFGGLAKGYAARRMARVLEARGMASGLVNLGRSSLVATRLDESLRAIGDERMVANPNEWVVVVEDPHYL